MNPADAFVLAISQSPDDDSLRLMYADWLDDQGDARGELIRLQCALARSISDAERTDLQIRETALLAEHSADWVQPLSHLGKSCRLYRGFAEVQVNLPTLLAQAANWQPSPLVLQVRVTDSQTTLSDLMALASSPALSFITTLELRRPTANSRDLLQALAELPPLPRLMALKLECFYGSVASLRLLIQSPLLGSLSSLSLRCNGLNDETVEVLAQASALARLTALDLGVNQLGGGAAKALAGASCLGRLTALDLERNDIGAAGAGHLAESARLPSLTHLRLNGNRLGSDGARALVAGTALGRLESLELRQCGIGDSGVRALAASRRLARLSRLDLTANQVTDCGVRSLAVSRHLARLRCLRLGWNDIHSAGVRSLAASPYLRRLSALDLSRTQVDSDGIRALASALELLTDLDLSEVVVEDAGTDALTNPQWFTRLTRLRVGTKGMSDAARLRLCQRFGEPDALD